MLANPFNLYKIAGEGDYAGASPENPDEHRAENVLQVPADARWSPSRTCGTNAEQPTIGKTVDDAMVAIERDNQGLKGFLPNDYDRPGLDAATRDSASPNCEASSRDFRAAKDPHRLGELIDPIATIILAAADGGESTHRSVDLLCRSHEYSLTRLARTDGKHGGQFYTLPCVVRYLVEMLAPHKGRIYDPACSSGPDTAGFVHSETSFESQGAKLGDISTYGQESNATTRRFAIRGIEADIGKEHADAFRNVQHLDPALRDADTATRGSAKPKPRSHSAGLLRSERQLLANPPFNGSDCFPRNGDRRWQWSGATWTTEASPQAERGGVQQFGIPPKGNANFARVQHFTSDC